MSAKSRSTENPSSVDLPLRTRGNTSVYLANGLQFWPSLIWLEPVVYRSPRGHVPHGQIGSHQGRRKHHGRSFAAATFASSRGKHTQASLFRPSRAEIGPPISERSGVWKSMGTPARRASESRATRYRSTDVFRRPKGMQWIRAAAGKES
jgi:hypothetical protein